MDKAVTSAPYTDFIATLDTVQSQPLWDRYHLITTRQPQTRTGAHLWSWKTMEPLVQRAVDEVAMADAERQEHQQNQRADAGEFSRGGALGVVVQLQIEPGNELADPDHRVADGAHQPVRITEAEFDQKRQKGKRK